MTDERIDGRWTLSNDQERWPGHEFFDTKEEAIAAAPKLYDHPCWVGRAKLLTADYVADMILRDLDETDVRIGDDEVFWCEDGELFIAPSRAQEQELHDLVVGWLTRHKLVRTFFAIEDSERTPDVLPDESREG